MTTKLDELVGYLAGREGSPKLKEELTDPSSEASLFLEATRSRSRALIQEPPVEAVAKASRFREWLLPLGLCGLLTLATLVLAALIHQRIGRLEDKQTQSDAEARSRANQLQLTLNRLTESRTIETGFDRIESGFDRFEKRLDRLEKSQTASKVDPILVELRESLGSLRKEFSVLEKANLRQAEDLRVNGLEIARLLRLLVTRSQPGGPDPVPDFPNPRRP